MSEWVERSEDLEVFRRPYRLSLEVHRASLDFPADRAAGAGRPSAAGLQIDLRQSGRRVLVGNACRGRSLAAF